MLQNQMMMMMGNQQNQPPAAISSRFDDPLSTIPLPDHNVGPNQAQASSQG